MSNLKPRTVNTSASHLIDAKWPIQFGRRLHGWIVSKGAGMLGVFVLKYPRD